MNGFCFDKDQFSALFPYYICVDGSNKIESFGSYLSNICYVKEGEDFASLFSYKRIIHQLYQDINVIPRNEVLVIRSITAPNITLKGQFQSIQDGGCIFIGKPSYTVEFEPADSPLDHFSTGYIETLSNADIDFNNLNFENLEGLISKIKQQQDEENHNYDRFALTISGVDGKVLWCNKKFEQLSGRGIEEVVGKRPRDAVYGKRSVYIDRNFVDNSVTKGVPFYFENLGYTKAGKEFWFGVVVHPVFDKGRNIIGRVHLLQDITVRKTKELKQQEAEDLLELAFEASDAGAWSYDLISGEINISDIQRKILGLKSDDELTAREYMALMHPDDKAELKGPIFKRLTQEEPGFSYGVRMKVNGSYRFFNVRAKCMQWGGDGEPLKLVGTLRDITKERNHMHELDRQKKFYHNILDDIPADIALFTPDHKYAYVNKFAIKNDAVREWIIGKDDFEYYRHKGLSPELAIERHEKFTKVLASGKQERFMESTSGENGTKYMLRAFSPAVNVKGEIEFVIGYSIDITEQVVNEQKIIMQEKRMQNFLDIINDGVFRCSEDGVVNMYSNSFLKIMNIDRAESTDQQKINFLKLLPEDELKSVEQSIVAVKATGMAQFGVFCLPQNNEKKKYIDYSVTLPVRTEDAAFIVRISDITDEVLKEKNLQIAINNEVELNRRKNQFIHIASHELRTPLSIIQANSEIIELLLENPELQKKKDPLVLTSRIIKEVEVMTDILNQLMMVSKAEKGDLQLNRVQMDVRDYILKDIRGMYAPYIDGRHLEVDIAKEVTNWRFDPKILKHALVNLLTNAFKYSLNRPAPKLHISVNEDRLEFCITDFGMGIPAEEMGRLFESFYRASNVGGISGTGIGLMVVDYAVRKHGGTINITSELDKGAVFTISIPGSIK